MGQVLINAVIGHVRYEGICGRGLIYSPQNRLERIKVKTEEMYARCLAGESLSEIARAAGISRQAVHQRLKAENLLDGLPESWRKKRRGVRTRSGAPQKKQLRERIRKMYKAAKTRDEIAREVGVSVRSVTYHLQQLGVRFNKSPLPVGKDGKRPCTACGKRKVPTNCFSPRHSKCLECTGVKSER